MDSPFCRLGTLTLWAALVRIAGAEAVPAAVEQNVVLAPNSPYHIRVPIGEAKFVSFSCMGGVADVIVSLSTFAEHADPLLFLSLNPDELPSFKKHDSSNFAQWQEDAQGDHYVVAKDVSPEGGIVGLVNVRPFAKEELDGVLNLQCTYIIAFDALFWRHLRLENVCPVGSRGQGGTNLADTKPFCSGNGACVEHGVCECDGRHAGAACEHDKVEATTAEGRYRFTLKSGNYQYLRVRVPEDFAGGFLETQIWGDRPLVTLVRGEALPTKSNFELSNFEDWVSARNESVIRYVVPAANELVMPGKPRRLGQVMQERYVFVGVYNHRRYFDDVSDAHVIADVTLKVDPDFAQNVLPATWLSDLYNPFVDISSLELPHKGVAQGDVYPEGDQFIYNMRPVDDEGIEQQVKVYRDRMTLLHIPNEDLADRLHLSFTGANVSHVLVSTKAAPKTLFDFNSAPGVASGRAVEINAEGEPALWCAVFGTTDGWANVVAARRSAAGRGMPLASACVALILATILFLNCGVSKKLGLGQRLGFDDSISLSERLWCWVTRQAPHESTVGLTREDTMTGFVGSDVVDQSIEDQYLHRGGMGDDGI